MKTFGLLGKRLGHSFSPAVHAAFGNPDYHLFETDDPLAFLAQEPFDGLNVTIPYKELVARRMDVLDPVAQATGAVNTVVRRNGSLYGYNTDYEGVQKSFARAGVLPAGRSAAVLGNGGAAKTVVRYLLDAGAARVDVFCRHPREARELPLGDAGGDYEILVNATPVGTHPDDDGAPPVDLDRFPRLAFVLDLVYHPLRTNLVLAAQDRGIAAASGLYMLVMQARRSHELFLGTAVSDADAETVYRDLAIAAANLVLIGLPLSGKSMYAGMLARKYDKKAIDTDAAIETREGATIPDLFRRIGEAGFRAKEEELVAELRHERGLVISTGGGMILNVKAMERLRRNGVVVFLDKDYRKIMEAEIHNRPLIQSPADVERLALARRPLYEKYADFIVPSAGRREETASEIEAKLHAYFDRQRS